MKFKDFLKDKALTFTLIVFSVLGAEALLSICKIHIFIKIYIVISVIGGYLVRSHD